MSDMCLVDKRELAMLRSIARKAQAMVNADIAWDYLFLALNEGDEPVPTEEQARQVHNAAMDTFNALVAALKEYNHVAKAGRGTKSQDLTSLDKKNLL